MTRRSKRELERELEKLGTRCDDIDADPCPECGGGPPGTDARLGVTAEFATYECTCDEERHEESTRITFGRGDR